MEAKELRIGNLFFPINRGNKIHLPNNIPFKVITIGFKIEAIPYSANPAEVETWNSFQQSDLCGVPLTEEWLLKFGFKKLKKESSGYQGYLLNSIEVGNNGEFYIEFSNRDNEGNEITVFIKYVHQLQNLFLALTQTELEIKL